jgi:hypothetical protein
MQMIKATWKESVIRVCEECDEDIDDACCDECDGELLPAGADEFFCGDGFHICLECAEKRKRGEL